MRVTFPLVVMLVASTVRAEPTEADFDNQLAKLTPMATKDERLAVAKWLSANAPSKHAPRAISSLEKLAQKDSEPAVRQAAVAALVYIVNKHDVPCPLGLVVALRDPVDEVRWQASVLAGPYKRRMAAGALEALLATPTDERVDVRIFALFHLADAAGKDPKARAVIEKAKEDKVFEVRNAAHSAWFTATDDLAALLTYIIRVREEPKAVLNELAEGSEEAKQQQIQRNLFILGSTSRIIDWTEDRPDDLAAALLKLLGDKSAAMRRGAADAMGLSARKIVKPPKRPDGLDFLDLKGSPLESLLPRTDPEVPKAKPQPSKAYLALLARKADAALRDLAAKDPDETVRTAAKQALERWSEVPLPPDFRPAEPKR